MKTIVGLYDDIGDAHQTVRDLVDAGIPRDDISLVASDRNNEYSPYLENADMTGTEAEEGAVEGAVAGGAIGGLAGLLLGLGAFAIPGVGPIIGAGPLAAALTGAAIGAAGGGLLGALVGWGIPETEAGYYSEGVNRGGTLVAVRTADNMVDQVVAIMDRYNPVDIDRRVDEWRASGWTNFDSRATAASEDMTSSYREREVARPMTSGVGSTTSRTVEAGSEARIPVVEEEVRVGKREVERGGVRVHTHLEERPIEEDVTVREEHVRVERRPVDRPAGEADFDAALREGTIEVTERAEEVIVEKRPRVVEEVIISKDVDQRTETVRDSVRRTDVEVEQLSGQTTTSNYNYNTFAPRFRTHYDQMYARSGRAYSDYEPAYRYGYDLATDDRYRGREWDDIAEDVATDWGREFDEEWEEFKGAVRQGWEEVKDVFDDDDYRG
jgi:stress response protein YsnF